MFQFQFDYTLEDLNALSRVSGKTYRRKRVLISRIAFALLGVVYLGMGASILSFGSVAVSIIMLIAGMLFLALFLFYHQGTAWSSKRMMVEKDGELTVTVEEDGVRGKGEKGESIYPYTAIIGAYHYRQRYFLFLDKRHAVLLPERALTQGDPTALKGFLEEKLGKEIKELH